MEYQRLSDYIREVNVRNRDLKVTRLLGVGLEKKFFPSIANIIGTDLSNYKVIRKGQFGCKFMSVGRDGILPVSILDDDEPAIISSAYYAFEVNDPNELLPEYLMMWLRRPEFDRELWFYSGGDVRGGVNYEAFCDMPIFVPSLARQREIVSEYETLTKRIRLNEQMIARLEETAQALYRKMFVDGVDMEHLPEGWRRGKLSDIAEYSKDRIDTSTLDTNSYISTENMIKDKGGVTEAESIPKGKSVRFQIGDILLSNIRPYFKKVWKCTFGGGCSADVLCIRTKRGYPPEYTYSVVESDRFFDYVMAGCKGTKMPRGDKEWNMNYKIPIPSNEVLEAFQDNTKRIGDYCELLRNENAVLIKTKDLLLSKLSKLAT